MGGCKCTYRTCTVRSDGKTHMFHYPVFDKVRCHQWLTNAQRLDFLNLKVSQLKNRVVCQHHFKPENFMNFKKDKLTFDAVPTENGPYCDEYTDEINDIERPFSISIDEIENDQLSLKEKKANFTVKYGDFLINSEMDPMSIPLNKEPVSEKKKLPLFTILTPEDNQPVNKCSMEPCNENIDGNQKSKSVINLRPTPTKQTKKNIQILSEKKICTPFKVHGKLRPVSPSVIITGRDKKENNGLLSLPVKEINKLDNMEVIIYNPEKKSNNSLHNQNSVLSCSVIEPHTLHMGQIEPVLDSEDAKGQSRNIFSHQPKNDASDGTQNLVEILIPPANEADPTFFSLPANNVNMETKPKNLTPVKSLLKSKIPPERIAAINEKRNFNKKLRDMIEFCLDDTEVLTRKSASPLSAKSQSSKHIQSKPDCDSNEATELVQQKQLKSPSVASHLSKELSLPNEQQYNLAAIEARMANMQEILLKKINENSQRILDLKNMLVSSTPEKKNLINQAGLDKDENYKRQLYEGISQYLSSDLNSSIYEELFLNKYTKRSEKSPSECSKPMKRRRRK